MTVSRYVVVQAIQTPEGELIPIWDKRINYRKTQEYGNMIKVDGEYNEYSVFIDVIYDLKKRVLSHGIEIDVYPDKKGVEFTKGEEVYFEFGSNHMKEGIVVDIIFEEYDLSILKGSKIEKYHTKHFEFESIDKESIYALKYWKPTFVMNDGTKILYSHQIKHKVKN